MKKIVATFAASATALSTMLVPAPAFAVAPTPTTEMQEICAATTIVQPDPNSQYKAALDAASIQAVDGPEFLSKTTVVDDTPGGVLVGTVGPTFTGMLGRNGQSPNIFGEFKTVSEYTGGSYIAVVEYSQKTTFTYQCVVYKLLKNGRTETPNGLQPPPLTIQKTVVTRTDNINITKPNTFVTTLSDAVVCNSPLKNPGVWRNQNGYTGACSTALFNSLPGMPIHSNSQPPLEESLAPDLFVESYFDEVDGPASVTDDEWELEEIVS